MGGPSLTCDVTELMLLARLLGGTTLIGVPDPFKGWLASEIEDALIRAARSLTERKILRMGEGNRLVLDAETAALTITSMQPVATLVVHRSRIGEVPFTRYFHLNGIGVEMAVQEDAIPRCELIGYDDLTVVSARLVALFDLAGQTAPAVPSARLTWTQLQEARRIAPNDIDATVAFLSGCGVNAETGGPLALTLRRPIANGGISVLANRNEQWSAAGFNLLEGEGGLWMIRMQGPDEAPEVEVAPCSATEAIVSLNRLVHDFGDMSAP